MSNIQILKYNNIDFANLDFCKINKQKDIVYIKYNLNNKKIPFLIETEYMYMPVDGLYENLKMISYEIILLLSKSNQKMSDFFLNLDKKIIDCGKQNIDNWPFDKENKIRYKTLVRDIDNSEGNYGNIALKLKLTKSNDFKTLIFDDKRNIVQKNKIDDILISGKYVKVIFELPCLWFKNNNFGLSLKVHQIKVSTIKKNKPKDTSEFLISEDTE